MNKYGMILSRLFPCWQIIMIVFQQNRGCRTLMIMLTDDCSNGGIWQTLMMPCGLVSQTKTGEIIFQTITLIAGNCGTSALSVTSTYRWRICRSMELN